MKIRNSFLRIVLVIFFGGLWAYSFSTRIGLLFIVPLWLKIIVMGGLGLNFSLLASYLLKRLIIRRPWDKSINLGLIIVTILSALVFFLIPYRRVPFRTTHQLEIQALDSEAKLAAVYSPDDNLIPREEFEPDEYVTAFNKSGFQLPPGSTINYRRSQTGGLTLSFTQDSTNVRITWDGVSHIFDSSSYQESHPLKINGWRTFIDEDNDLVNISLPGHTWGDPDPFWTVLGVILPVADFVTLASLFAGIIWVFQTVNQVHKPEKRHKFLIKIWVDALVCIILAVVLIKIGFPDFIPLWFLLFFIPTVLFLAYHQIQYSIEQSGLNFQVFWKFKMSLGKIGGILTSFNHSRWLFWILIILMAILGASIQLHLTIPGMGISGDSVHYMEGAKNMALGRGYVRNITEDDPVVITGFPPIYSTFLLPGILLGMEVQQFARFLNTLLISLSVILTGWIIFKTTGKVFPALIANLFLLMSPMILSIYSWVMSEPLSIVLLLVTILVWFWQINDISIWKVLLTGILIGIMINTRLAAIAFLPAFVVGILLFQKGKFGQRLHKSILVGLAALIPPAAFFIRNSIVAETISESRGLTLATFTQEYWEIIGAEVSSWFKWQTYFNLPHQRFNAMFVALSVILLLTIGWLAFRKQLSAKDETDPIIITLLISIPLYFSIIVLNTILFTPNQTVYGLTRYMIPILLLLLILISKILSVYWKQPYLFSKIIILFIILVGLQLYFVDFSMILQEQPFGYRQYTDRQNQCGDEVSTIVSTIPDVTFFTNNCEYFYFMTGQQCRHMIFDTDAYQPGGEIYQALKAGDIIAFTEGFGSNPPGVQPFLQGLDQFASSCYLNFYRWPNTKE